jgi:hypothetical protein
MIIDVQASAIMIARPLMTRELVVHLGVSDTCMRVAVMMECLVGRQGALDLSSLPD